jgi:Tfp pilus assembly protein PilO
MKQNKTIFFIFAAILIIIVIYWFFSFLVIDVGEQKKIKQGIISAENDFVRLRNERGNYTSIKDTREKRVQYFNTLKEQIPSKENIRGANSYVETLDIIQRIAGKNNIIIDVFKPILINTFPEIEVEDKQFDQTIERYLLEMECNGDFISIGKFLEEMQNQDRIINLLKFNIETEYGAEGRLFCEAILYTYVFSENY